jgi:glycosyltransferase involved in cell wall biosynthesis
LEIKDVSLIHYNAWPASLWNWLPRICGIPSLMEGHGLEWQRSKYSPISQKIMKFMEAFTARINHHLIMCSEGQVSYFKKEYGVDSVCIPGAVSLPDLSLAETSSILDRFNLTKGRYFLFLGILVQDKNPDYLIKAFQKSHINDGIEQDDQHWKLVIAGANDSMPQYVEYLKNLAQSRDVVFTGAVYNEDKSRLLKDAYCFCLPSTIEGLSIVMMEAASYKLPIIASNIEANQEFLKEDAIYVRPENEDDLVKAIVYAVACPQQLDKLKAINYTKLLDSYTWDKVALKYVEYLNSIGVKG